MSDYEKVKAILPTSMKCDVWHEVQNGFEALVTERGAYKMRRKVKNGAWIGYELFSLTPKGGLKSIGIVRL